MWKKTRWIVLLLIVQPRNTARAVHRLAQGCLSGRSLRGGCFSDDEEPLSDGGRGPMHSCEEHAAPRCRSSDMLLWKSAAEADVDGVLHALQQGASVNARNFHDSKRGALHYVVSNRNTSCVHCSSQRAPGNVDPTCRCRMLVFRELIRSGGDVSLPCALGARPLHLAAATGAVALCEALVDAGASVNSWDHSHRRALQFAAHGAHVNAPDTYGTTPLAAAARHGHASVVELLLQWGAEVDVYDRLGYSPYALALKSDSQRCKALLSDLHHLFRPTQETSRDSSESGQADGVTTESDAQRIGEGDDSYWNDLVFTGGTEERGEVTDGDWLHEQE